MTEPKFTLIKRSCVRCKQKYDQKVYEVLGSHMVLDGGMCPPCKEKDAVELAEREANRIAQEHALKRAQFLFESGIPAVYLTKTFDSYDKTRQPKPFAKAKAYADSFPISKPFGYPSLLLFSEHSWGTGKTHLACAIGHAIIDHWNGEHRGNPVYFISEPDLLGSIRATYDYDFEEKRMKPGEADIIDRCKGVSLLILDDIGKEDVGDPKFVQRILFNVIDGRYKNGLPMVLTTNLNTEELRTHLGAGKGNEAIYDRLREMTRGKFTQMDGKSFR